MSQQPKKRNPLPKEVVKEKLRERKKLAKQLLRKKRARLIVKNLPFKVNEEQLKEYFEKFGKVENVELLKKPDGKLVGCSFVQFEMVQKAAKAKHHTNGKEFLGRHLVVDFAKAKNKYNKVEVKIEPEVEIKKEDDEDQTMVSLDDVEGSLEQNMQDSDKNRDSEGSEEEISDDEDNSHSKSYVEENEDDNKPKRVSNDVTEGKTIFVRNVPFDATKEDLKQCMLQYGPVYYALICVDKLTEHSKGTAFVKFVNKEDADKALSAGTELTLLGNILDCHPALHRDEVQKKAKEKKEASKGSKDNRNLYLVKEGVILAGSKAAHGVSPTDMAKRLQIEQYKTQVLRNLNMFISRERLIVHNLPSTWDDKKLKLLFQKHAGEGAVIIEARVMRDMQNLDANGLGKSKEYGFVSFTKHEHALKALRSLNNNPNIFAQQKRPIISFSIENKVMIKAKQKRLEKSRMYNPTSKDFKPRDVSKSKDKRFIQKKHQSAEKIKASGEAELPGYSGVPTEPGKVEKMRSRYKLVTQAKMHYENVKKAKKMKKNQKKTLGEKRKEFTKQPRQKINKKTEQDSFSKMVNEYKRILSAPPAKKSKWYEGS
ncbi:unnamed protein product [Acanthoscelides obtectus]|uniref:RRM domain-containing protein n=1 Tax=Acanthoscelides obtectus TaxID=200917 RepID=A0A9P0LZZ6_ACAOB|nr:unnamed protein product [Acanthoscelides obtectus]CAK1668394.1 RNA-binding protein 28 [Acanthoscelides obtectus]